MARHNISPRWVRRECRSLSDRLLIMWHSLLFTLHHGCSLTSCDICPQIVCRDHLASHRGQGSMPCNTVYASGNMLCDIKVAKLILGLNQVSRLTTCCCSACSHTLSPCGMSYVSLVRLNSRHLLALPKPLFAQALSSRGSWSF